MDTNRLSDLMSAFGLAIRTKGRELGTIASIATSRSGASYAAGAVESQTHLLDVPPELAALVRATHHSDYAITAIDTLVTDPTTPVSPLVLKILADHGARTGLMIRYGVYDLAGRELFATDDARNALPFYKVPVMTAFGAVAGPAAPTTKLRRDESTETQLRIYALEGSKRNFPTRVGASGYGAAVLAADGTIYFGGQYSTFEKRLGVHAEMGVLLNALMSGAERITHIGIASSKFPETPVSPCGACRQFIAEVCALYGFAPTIVCFASESDRSDAFSGAELLPVQWTSTP